MKHTGGAMLEVTHDAALVRRNHQLWVNLKAQWWGHTDHSKSDKHYHRFMLGAYAPPVGRPVLKVHSETGEMYSQQSAAEADRDAPVASAVAPAASVTAPVPATAATAATAAATAPATAAVLDVTGGDEPAPKRRKVNADKYAEGGSYMSAVGGWMASGIECEWT